MSIIQFMHLISMQLDISPAFRNDCRARIAQGNFSPYNNITPVSFLSLSCFFFLLQHTTNQSVSLTTLMDAGHAHLSFLLLLLKIQTCYEHLQNNDCKMKTWSITVLGIKGKHLWSIRINMIAAGLKRR